MQDPTPSLDERLLVATAVSFDGIGIEIDPSNVNVQHAPVRTLVASDSCFTVQVDSHLLAVDHDDVDDQGVFEELCRALWTAGLDPVICESGGSAHRRHLFVPAPRGRRRTAWHIALAARGLDVRKSIRPPFTLHRSSGRSMPEGGLDAAGITSRLVPSSEEDLKGRWHVAGQVFGGAAALSERMLRVLGQGHTAGGYKSPSEGRMALAAAVLGAEGTISEVAALLDEQAFKLGDSWRRRGSRWKAQELERLNGKALAYLERASDNRITNRKAALVAVAAWRGRLGVEQWHGAGAATRLAVAEGMAVIAEQRGGPRFVASFDEIALEAGVTRGTAKRACAALVDARLVRRDHTGGGRFAPLWMLLGGGDAVAAPKVGLGIDAARYAGLGKATVRVARDLGIEPVRASVLAERYGLGTEAVRRHLRRLRDHGLAEFDGNGWHATGELVEGTLAATAQDLGTAGAGEQQRAAIEDARLLRAQYLATLDSGSGAS